MIDAIATPRNGRDNDHTQYITYTVTPEDEEQCRSVAAFALRSDLDVNEFMAMNALRMDDNLYAGQVLRVGRKEQKRDAMEKEEKAVTVVEEEPGKCGQVQKEKDGESAGQQTSTEHSGLLQSIWSTLSFMNPFTSPESVETRNRSQSLPYDTSSNDQSIPDPFIIHDNAATYSMDEIEIRPRAFSDSGFNREYRPVLKSVKLLESKFGSILSKDQINAIRLSMPIRLRRSDWRLIYSDREHGTSLRTLYRRSEALDYGPCVIVIQNDHGNILGAFSSDTLSPRRGYYGSGESFVFSFASGEYRSYHWTRRQSHCVYSSDDVLGFGEGALWINASQSVLQGSSRRCPTFDNEPLNDTENFDVVHIEVWSFDALGEAPYLVLQTLST